MGGLRRPGMMLQKLGLRPELGILVAISSHTISIPGVEPENLLSPLEEEEDGRVVGGEKRQSIAEMKAEM